MKYPTFFDSVESITLYDPLSDFLGALEDGILEIEYIDIVKFAGHSCPTVAGAYLMSKLGLQKLYPKDLPKRGEIKVYVRGKKVEGVNGVIGNVVAFICGVSDEAGFKGIGGRFDRSNKLFFDADIDSDILLERVDNATKIGISYNPSVIPPNLEMKPLMQKILMGQANEEEKIRFKHLWQERVQKILLSKDLWPQMITFS